MNRRLSLYLMLLTTAFLLMLFAAGAQNDETVAAGWYTEEQAERGGEAYDEHCARCHGDDLRGGMGPALAGDRFMRSWRGETVFTLYRIIHDTMPQDDPSSLSEDTYADIVAHILHENRFPAGDEELVPEREQLEKFTIDPELTEDEED